MLVSGKSKFWDVWVKFGMTVTPRLAVPLAIVQGRNGPVSYMYCSYCRLYPKALFYDLVVVVVPSETTDNDTKNA